MTVAGKPRVFLLTPCFMPYDAVGNDVYAMWKLLREAGYDASIHAEECAATYSAIASKVTTSSDLWRNPDDILIYHHSIGWALGQSILARTHNKVVIRYHNITPSRFYESYAGHYYQACINGEQATRQIARLHSVTFWGASEFNVRELANLGADGRRCRSLPPCHLAEEISAEPFDGAAMAYRDGRFNVLFVGGMKPNKGHQQALRAFAAYRHLFNGNARLIFAGSFDPGLSAYLDRIQRLSEALQVADATVFAHSVTAAQLRTLYYVAGAFLCTSEHEGFCVPLVEAMCLRVPILAVGVTAVPETVGTGGILATDSDPIALAGSLDRLQHDSVYSMEIASLGRLRYETEFHPKEIQRKTLSLLSEVEAAPRRRPS